MKKIKALKKFEKNEFARILGGGWQRIGMGATKEKGDNGASLVPPLSPLENETLRCVHEKSSYGQY